MSVGARAFLEEIKKSQGAYGQMWIDEAIRALDNADAKQGRWLVSTDCEGKTRTCTCSNCKSKTGQYTWRNPNFCDECGADMRQFNFIANNQCPHCGGDIVETSKGNFCCTRCHRDAKKVEVDND